MFEPLPTERGATVPEPDRVVSEDAADRELVLAALRPLIAATGAALVGIDAGTSGTTGDTTGDTDASGDLAEITDADVAIRWGGDVVAAVRLPPIHGSLDRLIAMVETELGGPLASLSRPDKQQAVRRLDELGAFVLRRAVEDIAAAMAMSRITVYSYLNALHR